jgi:hypothetical protein
MSANLTQTTEVYSKILQRVKILTVAKFLGFNPFSR